MFNCVFCGKPYSPKVWCCDKAALSAALTAIKYHVDCDHEEVRDVIAQLEDRQKAWEDEKETAMRP